MWIHLNLSQFGTTIGKTDLAWMKERLDSYIIDDKPLLKIFRDSPSRRSMPKTSSDDKAITCTSTLSGRESAKKERRHQCSPFLHFSEEKVHLNWRFSSSHS